MQERRAPGIAVIATKYGLVQGVLAFIVFIVRTLTGSKHSWIAAAVDAALLIVLIVLAHREFKKTHGGMMRYPQGLGSGTLLACIAAAVTCILVYVYVKYINAGYLEAATHATRAALAQRGISGAQAQQAMAISSAILTPIGVAITSLITGVIMGFIVALIVSIFTQRGDPSLVV
ncbi:MAG: DUF4199 domain-containing protein [Steroidobacteraceae bacterium]